MKRSCKFISIILMIALIITFFAIQTAAAENEGNGIDYTLPAAEDDFEPDLTPEPGTNEISILAASDIILPAVPIDGLNITITPKSTNEVTAGDTAVFTVSVNGGTKPYTYQWQYWKPSDQIGRAHV